MTHKRVDKTSKNPLSLESRSPFSVLRSPFSVLRYVTSRNSSLVTLAILALLICAALAFTACPAEPPAASTPEVDLTTSTYTIKSVFLSNTSFTSVFGSPVPTAGNARLLTLTKADLTTGKFKQAETADGYSLFSDGTGTGFTYSTLEDYLDLMGITATPKTQMLNALKSPGVTGVAIFNSSSSIGVIGIIRE